MHVSSGISRRHFLQTTGATVVSCLFPRSLLDRKPEDTFWFVHADTQESWPVGDPVQWSLQNIRQPILAGASERLMELTPLDGNRIIRLLVRRCRLNLVELHPGRVAVHYWAQQRADLRPFFKAHGLARPEIEVVLRERKKEAHTTQTGDDFLFGDRLATAFPLDLYRGKWQDRFQIRADDWTPAPGTRSGYAWGDVGDRIPWIALKSAWRRNVGPQCANCNGSPLLTNFGDPWVSFFNRSPRFVTVCGACRRSFRDESVKSVTDWMTVNLDADLQPAYEMIQNRRVKR